MTFRIPHILRGVVWLALLLHCIASPAEDPRFLHLQSWSTEEGLPQNSVHRILQTRDGYLWIATEGGVARFDGINFRVFQHAVTPSFVSDDVCCLAEDRSGALWFGTSDGLVRLQQGVFRRFTTSDGLPSSSILALASMADGSLLVLTADGLVEWSEERSRRLPPAVPVPSDITALDQAKDGGAWLVSETELLLLRNRIVRAIPCPVVKSAVRLMGVVEGINGTVWLRYPNNITVCSARYTRTWSIGKELPGVRVESLSIDREGRAWVGTSTDLLKLNADSNLISRVPALNGNTILQTFEDAEGNEWVGTETDGLKVLRSLKFHKEPGLADQAFSSLVQASDGAIWVGTREDGLRRLRAGLVDEPIPAGRLTSSVVLSLAPGENGSVWVGTPDGLNHVMPDGTLKKFTSADGLPDDFIRCLSADKDGSVWIGTRHGLSHLKADRIDTLTNADGLGGDLVGSLLRDDQENLAEGRKADLWIGTSGGLSRLRPSGKITTYTSRDGLPDEIVTAMAQDSEGILWIATRNGELSKYWQGKFVSVISKSGGSNITGVSADRRGFLWLRASRGIQRISLQTLSECASEQRDCSSFVSQYGVADGLPSEESIAGGSPTLWRTVDGQLWSPTRRGVAVADADALPMNLIAPPIVLQNLVIDETSVDFNPKQPLQIGFGYRRLTLEYAALSFTAPSQTHYRFMLQNFDHEWTEAGSRRSATYTNLPPNTYSFKVQASNNDGIWSEPKTLLQFRVVPPFYRRWWFVLLSILAALSIVGALYRLRLRRLRHRFDAVLLERNRMAREIHDTLAQDFVGVSIQLDLVSHLLSSAKVDAAQQQIKQTRKLVNEGLADARRSIWELRANTAQGSLPTLLSKVVERYTNDSTVTALKIGGAFRQLPSAVEGEILRVAQEALSNIQRHARATEVSVEMQYGRDTLVLAIVDNGRGFLLDGVSAREGHYGLQGMRERTALLGGRLELTSELGEGTKVVLFTPITTTRGN